MKIKFLYYILVVIIRTTNKEGYKLDHIIDQLKKIGFSKYESKAYIALLKQSPVTGYEISKQSGVPRSMIYQTINKLIAQGAVNEIRSDPLTYSPVPAKELIGRLKREKDHTFRFLEEQLQTLEQPPEIQVIRHNEGKPTIIDTLNTVILKAQHEVWLSLWSNEINDVKNSVEKSLHSGVQFYSLLFNSEPTKSFGTTFYHHPSTSTVEEQRMGQRLTVLVRDDKEVIIASFSKGNTPVALQTEDPMLVLLAKEYIRHDMMMKVTTEKFGEKKMNALWESDPSLFYIISGQLFHGK